MKFFLIIFLILFTACSVDDASLESYLKFHSNLQRDNVIACAASAFENMDDAPVSVFFYPISGAKDFRYFESEKKEDLSSYYEVRLPQKPVYNGHLGRFLHPKSAGEWGIVTYLSKGKIHVSSPIKLKDSNSPTLFSQDVKIVDNLFIWENKSDNAIFFQIISKNNNLLSGTYTYDTFFQFYNLANVVLNIKNDTNPYLEKGNYTFTLMAISQDNWVNEVIVQEFAV